METRTNLRRARQRLREPRLRLVIRSLGVQGRRAKEGWGRQCSAGEGTATRGQTQRLAERGLRGIVDEAPEQFAGRDVAVLCSRLLPGELREGLGLVFTEAVAGCD